MKKHVALVMLLALPFAGCASDKLIQAPVASSANARLKVAFCAVAERQESVEGDPQRTQQQKAYHNGTGGYLCGWR